MRRDDEVPLESLNGISPVADQAYKPSLSLNADMIPYFKSEGVGGWGIVYNVAEGLTVVGVKFLDWYLLSKLYNLK